MNHTAYKIISPSDETEIRTVEKAETGINVLMIDPWIGNDYSLFLSSRLCTLNVNVSLMVTEDRHTSASGIKYIKILPGKEKSESKIKKLWKYLEYLGSLYSLVKSKEYNVIHFQAFRRKRIESLIFFLLSLKKINLMYTVHDVDPLDRSRTDALLNKIIYGSASSLIVHSGTNKKLLQDKYGINGEKIFIVPHGSFEESFPEEGLTKSSARKQLNLKENDNVILFFGAVKEYKGIDILLKAASIASEQLKDLVLIIAGKPEPDSLEQEYLKMIKNAAPGLKIIHHFNFIDKQDVESYFIAADIAVLPYKIISHSGVLHLAYSYGKPVIASRTGDFEEFVHHGKTGFLFENENISELSQIIVNAFSDKSKLIEMGEHAKEENKESFSWDLSAAKLKEVYQLIISLGWKND